jgi:outer membrane protein
MHKVNIAEFKKIEGKLREEETSILSQKNILSEVDYSIKVNLIKNKIDQYKKNRQEKINLVTKKRIDATQKLLIELNPILLDYSKENGISIILQKKNIVLARTDLDITDKIIEIANTKIKKIDLN